MKITKIIVGAARSSKADVRLEAELADGDDPQECARNLRMEAESMLAQHLTEIKNADEVKKRIAEANKPAIAQPPKSDLYADLFGPGFSYAPGSIAEVRLKDFQAMENLRAQMARNTIAGKPNINILDDLVEADQKVQWNNITLKYEPVDGEEEDKKTLTYKSLRDFVGRYLGKF